MKRIGQRLAKEAIIWDYPVMEPNVNEKFYIFLCGYLFFVL